METSQNRPRSYIQPARTWQSDTNALVITLRRSTTRAANVNSIIKTCPLSCELWNAVDGSAMSPELTSYVYQTQLHRPYYPFALRPGEIGCFLSHRNIWEKMVQQNIPRLLVLEDDIAFLPNFDDTLQHAIEQAADGAYVQFQVRNLTFPEYGTVDQLQPTLIRPALAPLRTSAQLVTLGAARRLLEFTNRFDRPVDAAIQMTWEHGVEVLVAMPQSVIEVSASIGGSTIAAKKRRPIVETIRREWNRARYRHGVAKCARQYSRQRVVRSAPIQKSA